MPTPGLAWWRPVNRFGSPSAGDDPGRFEARHRYADRIGADVRGGLRSGVGGTPTIFVNGRRHKGGYDEATLQRAIEPAALPRPPIAWRGS